jgi:hypothetical protein
MQIVAWVHQPAAQSADRQSFVIGPDVTPIIAASRAGQARVERFFLKSTLCLRSFKSDLTGRQGEKVMDEHEWKRQLE